MGLLDARSLREQAMRSLLQDEKVAIASLKGLPRELFPPMFTTASSLGSRKLLKALVQTWPFFRLPLGSPCIDPDRESWTRQAVLAGLDDLLSREVRPRTCKLRVLDLRDVNHKFWTVWCGSQFSVALCRRQPVSEGSSQEKHSAPLTVCIEAQIFRGFLDGHSKYMIDWAKKRRGVHLCCRRLQYCHYPTKHLPLIKIQLSCVQEVSAPYWIMTHPDQFACSLSCMTNLKRLDLDLGLRESFYPMGMEIPEKERLLGQFICSLQSLNRLRELYLRSLPFAEGRLGQLLRCLTSPLDALALAKCTVPEPDLTRLFQWPNIFQLQELCLRGVPLASVGEPLGALLRMCTATLRHLDLGACGLLDTHLEALLPALSLCSRLGILNLLGNHLSVAVLEQLLRLTAGRAPLVWELYPAPLESFHPEGFLNLEAFAVTCEQLLEVLRDLEQCRSIWLSSCLCVECGDDIFCNGEPHFLSCEYCRWEFVEISFRQGDL